MNGGDFLKYRHEIKIPINYADIITLKQSLSAVLKPDLNTINGKYIIRSIYFDNIYDKALKEKINGNLRREKFRLRFYNNDTNVIYLEKKSKVNNLCLKDRVLITRDEAQKIVSGDYCFMLSSEKSLVKELYFKIKTQGLKPKTVVEYTREPFIFSAGNVRITLDYNIRTGLSSKDFLNTSLLTFPLTDGNAVLEVKWDDFLPDIVKSAIAIRGRRPSAFSKYQISRIYD